MVVLDKPLVSFLKDLNPKKLVNDIENITLHQAMTMRSGFYFSDEQIKEFGTNTSQFKGIDQIQAFIKNEFLYKIGTDVYSCRSDLSGLSKADERSKITSRDMIQLGALVANK